MRPFAVYPVPQNVDRTLGEFLGRTHHRVRESFEGIHDLDVLSAPPNNPQTGMVRYADGVSWDPVGLGAERGVGDGPYFYDGIDWRPMFSVPSETWIEASSALLTLTPTWQTYLTLAVRPYVNADIIINASLICGATITQKNMEVVLRVLLNGVEPSSLPRYGFQHTYGSNLSLDMYQSVPINLAVRGLDYVIPDIKRFGGLTVEIQGMSNQIGDIDSGYLVLQETF